MKYGNLIELNIKFLHEIFWKYNTKEHSNTTPTQGKKAELHTHTHTDIYIEEQLVYLKSTHYYNDVYK